MQPPPKQTNETRLFLEPITEPPKNKTTNPLPLKDHLPIPENESGTQQIDGLLQTLFPFSLMILLGFQPFVFNKNFVLPTRWAPTIVIHVGFGAPINGLINK